MIRLLFQLCAALLLVVVFQMTPAQAQALRTWVSGVGDDVNPCSRTAPCKTFAGAISKTALNGEIDCIDPGGFGIVTITKSITIDCHQTMGSISNAGSNGMTIAYDSFGTTDLRKAVRIRGLAFQGTDTGVIGLRIIGGTNSAGSAVFIEDTLIDGNFGGAARGISDERSGGGELYITNSTVRNTGNQGVYVNPAAGASLGLKISVLINNIRVENCGTGYFASSAVSTLIRNSVFSGNTGAGVYGEGPLAPSDMLVASSLINGNGTGVQNASSSTVRLSDTDIISNGTAISGVSYSYVTNRIVGTIGASPTPLGTLSPTSGEQ
jgi:Right handed beta helix region